MTQKKLAEYVGVSRQRNQKSVGKVSELEKGLAKKIR